MIHPVHACPLPAKSALHDRFEPGDFLDCYCVTSDMAARPAAQIITSFPGWAQALVRLRNAAVVPLGLRADGPQGDDKYGVFPVESDTGAELIVGFDDKHLNFRVSVMQQDGRVTLATWVRRHNLGGRLYLGAILPFHILIVRDALARVGQGSMAAAA